MPLPAPARQSDETIADWLETRLTGLGSGGIGAGQARELLVREAGTTDASAGMALNAMARRRTILGNRYPFSVDGVGVRRTEPGATCYEVLLLLSSPVAHFRGASSSTFEAAAVLFENLVCRALSSLLGPQSVAIRFGWPSAEGRPREFSQAITWLAGRMGTQLGRAYRPPRRKDGGVDVVAWRPFSDGKPGFPIILVQGTLERDFVHKSRDIDRRTWAGWLAFDADPLTALAIPHTVASTEEWREMASNVIVLDRIRLASLLGPPDECPPDASAWLSDELAALRATLTHG